MWDNIHFLNDDNVDEYVQQDKVTLLNFFIAQHVECRMQATIIHDLALKYGDKYNFAVIDVTESPKTTMSYDIQSLPSLVIVRQGMILGGYRGLIEDKNITELLERLDTLQTMPLEEQFVDYQINTGQLYGKSASALAGNSASGSPQTAD